MNSPSSWKYNCRQNASETTVGFKGKKEELGWWEKKMTAARTAYQSSTSKRKERDSKHIRKELKEILSLQPSLYVQGCCVRLGFPEHFTWTKTRSWWNCEIPALCYWESKTDPKDVTVTHSPLYIATEGLWAGRNASGAHLRERTAWGSLNRKEANVCWNACIYFLIHKFNPSSTRAIVPPKTHIHLTVNQKIPES